MSSVINVYVSSAREDEEFRDSLISHLAPLQQKQVIHIWHRANIRAGLIIETEWSVRLSEAHIVLLLISKHFFASEECHSEKKKVMENQPNTKTRVIPIVLSHFDWKIDGLSKLQALPRNGKPIIDFKTQDEPLAEIAKEIRSIIEEFLKPEQEDSDEKKAIPLEQLRWSLMQLNYKPQVGVFQRFKGEQSQKAKLHIGAFFIHGEPSFGQTWLLSQLIYRLPKNEQTKAKVVKVPLNPQSCERSLTGIWSEIAKKIKFENFPPFHEATEKNPLWQKTQKKILESFQAFWQARTTILILSRVNEIDEAILNKFMQDFWCPLVNMAKAKLLQSPEEKGLASHYLLLFLVDEHDCIDKWKIPFTEQFDQTRGPELPVKFEKLGKFSHEVVENWLQNQQDSDTLPRLEKLTTQKILDNSANGEPESVLGYVCDVFEYDLHSELITI